MRDRDQERGSQHSERELDKERGALFSTVFLCPQQLLTFFFVLDFADPRQSPPLSSLSPN